MKRTGLQYRFDPLTIHEAWHFWNRCMWCGKNRWDCLHHIISPSSYGHKHSESNASILNSSPMHNSGCHLDNGHIHNRDMEIALLRRTYEALTKVQDYKFKEIDKEFMELYHESHYKEVLKWNATNVEENTKKIIMFSTQ